MTGMAFLFAILIGYILFLLFLGLIEVGKEMMVRSKFTLDDAREEDTIN